MGYGLDWFMYGVAHFAAYLVGFHLDGGGGVGGSVAIDVAREFANEALLFVEPAMAGEGEGLAGREAVHLDAVCIATHLCYIYRFYVVYMLRHIDVFRNKDVQIKNGTARSDTKRYETKLTLQKFYQVGKQVKLIHNITIVSSTGIRTRAIIRRAYRASSQIRAPSHCSRR